MELNELVDLIKNGEGEQVEFKESLDPKAGKTITAFLNTRGGMLIVGISDQGHIVGIRKKDIDRIFADILTAIHPRPAVHTEKLKAGNDLLFIIHVPKSEKLHTYGNIGYIRIGSTTRELELTEIMEKAGEALLIRFDEAPCPGATTETVSKELVSRYLEERKRARNVEKPSVDYPRVLAMLGIISNGKITNGGVLFFSPNPQAFYPQVSLRIIEFAGSTMETTLHEKIITGSIWEMIDAAYAHLSNIVKREATTKGFQKIHSPGFPLEALQEAVINALIHRNYFESADVRIFVFSDRTEILNPGSFPPDVSLVHPIHKPRNRLLSQYVYDIGYIEKYGSGIIKMQDLCRKNGYPLPEFILEGRQTKVVFYFMPLKIRMAVKDTDATNRLILGYLIKQKSARTPELVALTKISKNSVVDRLQKLIKQELVVRMGKGKSTSYALA